MIAAFVGGEYDSKRFSGYRDAVAGSGLDRAFIDSPDLSNANQNRLRNQMLGALRGYPNKILFRGVPGSTTWHLIELDLAEVAQLLYANFPPWVELSGGTRLVSAGVANMDRVTVTEAGTTLNENIKAVADRVRAGDTFREIILVGRKLEMPLVILEGHTRASAYVLAGAPAKVRAIAGTARGMDRWWLI